MNRILAIEPHADRGVRLQQLFRENLDTDLVLTTSTDAAIAAMTDGLPDLILTSTLLAPHDDQDLVAHLRATPALRHLPVLTIPLVADAPAHVKSPGLITRLLRRRHSEASPLYDIDAVVRRIEEALAQSKQDAARAKDEFDDGVEPFVEELVMLPMEAHTLREPQRRAPRWTRSDLPWLSSLKLSWGLDLRLVNMSSSGVLVESGMRLTPGSPAVFHIGGATRDLIVSGRVIRSRVATVDSLGVTYQAAAVFDQAFDALANTDGESSDAVDRLADLVAAVRERAAIGARPADLRAEFEAGVRSLITAREVRLRDTPIVENDGRDSVYFRIPTPDASPAVLQVTFDTNYQPRADEFNVIKIAAAAAAQVLPLTDTARQASVRLQVSAH